MSGELGGSHHREFGDKRDFTEQTQFRSALQRFVVAPSESYSALPPDVRNLALDTAINIAYLEEPQLRGAAKVISAHQAIDHIAGLLTQADVNEKPFDDPPSADRIARRLVAETLLSRVRAVGYARPIWTKEEVIETMQRPDVAAALELTSASLSALKANPRFNRFGQSSK